MTAGSLFPVPDVAAHRYRKPVWLTEFACSTDSKIANQLKLMRELLPWMVRTTSLALGAAHDCS